MTNWNLKDEELKRIMAKHNDPDNELESVANTKVELIPHLKNNPCWRRLPSPVMAKLEKATTFHGFNQALNMIYDYADDNKIWLGLQPI